MVKRIAALALSFTVAVTTPIFASDFDSMTEDEKAQAIGVYIEEIIKYINDNYTGSKEVSTEELMYSAMKAIAQSLDEYSDYLTPEEYNAVKESESRVWYAPDFVCTFDEDGYPKVTEIKQSSKAYQAGLRENTSIRAIGDISTYGIGEEEYNSLVTKSDVTSIKMKISQNNNIVNEINMPLTLIENPTVLTYDVAMAGKGAETVKFNDSSVGYVKITTFSNNTANEFENTINNLIKSGKTRLILDLRGNTGGYVEPAINIAKMIVPDGIIITARNKSGNATTYTSNLKRSPFKKYVVLTDSMTASASEILASAMQESGIAKIVGEQTYGKGVMQSVMDFGDAGVLKTTTQEYTTRLGHKINGVGITPDVSVGKILFVTEDMPLTSDEVHSAMLFLGFRIDKDNSIEKAVGSYQAEMNLPVTYKMDKATVNSINLEIYEDMINNDRILTAGYINILS